MGPDDFSVRGPAGPVRPAWLQRDVSDGSPRREGLSAAITEDNASERLKLRKKRRKDSDGESKARKKTKKQRKEKRHKEKKRRKRENG